MKIQQYLSGLFFRIDNWLQQAGRKRAILLLVFFVLASLITIARRVEVVTEPQFYAEDGVLWYAEAYHAESSLDPFFIPKQGYFQTVSRIGAWFSMLIDIQYAPLLFNLFAVFITVLPAVFFLSSRFDTLVPHLSYRVFLALAYILLPGASEVHANLTNAHWHLAIFMGLVIIASPSRSIGWLALDTIVLGVAGLSGPFIFFAWPLFAGYLYFRRSKEKSFLFLIFTLAFLVQAYSFLFIENDAPRSSAPLGATFVNFSMILGGNVFLKGMLGPQVTNEIRDLTFWNNGVLPVAVTFIGFTILGYFFYKARLEARLFVLFFFLILAGSLAFPMAHLTKPQWDAMSGGGTGRYYYLPILGWITALAYLFAIERNKKLQCIFGVALLVFVLMAIPMDFEVKKLRNYHFPEQVERFRAIEPGMSQSFKIPPGWTMTLVKRSDGEH